MTAALPRGVRRLARRHPPARPARPSRTGTAAPDLVGVSPAGAPVRVDTGDGSLLVVAFLTSSCQTCAVFWEALGGDDRGHSPDEDPAVVIVTPDPTTENLREVTRRAPAGAPVVMSSDAWLGWGVWGSPFFVVVADGVIRAEGVASSWAELLALIPAG